MWGTLINIQNMFIISSLDGFKGLFALFVELSFWFPYLVVFISAFIIFFFRNRNEIEEKKKRRKEEKKSKRIQEGIYNKKHIIFYSINF